MDNHIKGGTYVLFEVSVVNKEKRNGHIPVPDNLLEMLSAAQLKALPGIKCLGWEPRFVRRKMFQPPTLVMRNANDGKTGIMDEDGVFRVQEDASVREEENKTQDGSPKDLHYF